MEQIIPIIIGVVALIAGIILGKILFAKNTKKQVEKAEAAGTKNYLRCTNPRLKLLKKKNNWKQKKRFVQLKSEHDKEVFQRNQKISDAENRIKQKEQSINQKDQNVERLIKENECY